MSGDREPQDVQVELTDGSRVPCLVRRTGPNHWTALPAIAALRLDEIRTLHVDVLPAGGSIGVEVEPPIETAGQT